MGLARVPAAHYITYQSGDLTLPKVEPYRGKIVLGPEIFAEVVEDRQTTFTEAQATRFNLAALARRSLPAQRQAIALLVITPTRAQSDSIAAIYMQAVRAWDAACRGQIFCADADALLRLPVRDALVRADASQLDNQVGAADDGLLLTCRLLFEIGLPASSVGTMAA